MKIAKKYLRHRQRSVFEGFLTPSELKHLKNELLPCIVPEEDTAVLYTINDEKAFSRFIIGRPHPLSRTDEAEPKE